MLFRSCLALMFAVKKLRHYLQAHSVRLISRTDPIKYLMSKSCLVGERQNGLFCCKSLISPTSLRKMLRDKHLQTFLQIIQYQMIESSPKIFLMRTCFSLKCLDLGNYSLMELLEKMERGQVLSSSPKKRSLALCIHAHKNLL